MAYKYTYFDGKGRGELCRLVFVLKGKKFEDVRIKQAQWPTEKPKTPFGVLPTLTIGGKTYSDSMGIARYLAREFGCGGKNNLEMMEIDQVCGLWQDIFNTFVKFHFEQDPDLKKKYKKQADEEAFPKYLNALEKVLTTNGTGYYVGNGVTIADLAACDALTTCLEDSVVSKYTKVKANINKVLSIPEIKDYHESKK